MLKKILTLALMAFTAIITLGLSVVLFSVGLVALWYLMIILLLIWAVRRLYYFFKGEKPPTVMEQYYYYYNNQNTTPKQKKGRTIDYDEFKDK